MPRNRFLPLAIGPHIVLAAVTQEPPPQPAQRLCHIATLHFGVVHLSVYVHKGELERANILVKERKTTKNQATSASPNHFIRPPQHLGRNRQADLLSRAPRRSQVDWLGAGRGLFLSTADTTDPITRPTAMVSYRQDKQTVLLI